MENLPNSPNLDDLLKDQSSAEETTTEQLLSVITDTLAGLEGSLGSLHVSLRSYNARIATLENFVAYLLSKNPDTADKYKELLAKATAAAESTPNESVLPEMPAQA